MERFKYLLFTIGLAILMPGLVVGLSYAIRFMPNALINLPRREYWLAPERRQELTARAAESGERAKS